MHPSLPFAFLESLGIAEIGTIGFFILLLFGPRRLPEIARTLGRTTARLQRAFQDFKDQLMQEADEEPPPPAPRDPSPPSREPQPAVPPSHATPPPETKRGTDRSGAPDDAGSGPPRAG